MNTKEILKWIRETPANTLPYNVSGIGWGPKIVNEQETDEYCLTFFVKEKKSLDQLLPEEIIPKYFSTNSFEIRTDVQTQQIHSHLLLTDCHVLNNTTEPVKSNRNRTRPLRAGSESFCNWSNDYLFGGYVATLGTFVIDKNDGQIVALSNNHVFADSQVVAKYYTKNKTLAHTNTKKLSGYQPSAPPYVTWITENYIQIPQDYIGTCKVPVVIGNGNPNKDISGAIMETTCDAATLRLSSYNLLNENSLKPLGFDYNPPYMFATDEEIDSLLDTSSPNFAAPIFRSGRTCGPVGYPGNTYSCSLSVYGFFDSLVGYYNDNFSFFSNCLYIRGNVVAGRGGDSGSPIYALLNRQNPSLSAWKLIGLIFAGPVSDFPSYAIGCRITEIADSLNLAPWDGVTYPTLSSRPLYTITTDISSATITLSGRTFYQIGGI